MPVSSVSPLLVQTMSKTLSAEGRAMAAGAIGEPDPATLDALETEAARPELADLDTRSTSAIVELFADDQAGVIDAVRNAAPSIVAAADLIAARMSAGGRLIYVGAGTGGRIAALDAAEIGPSYGIRGRVLAVFAGGVDAMADGREFYEDDEEQGAREVAALALAAHDVVLGVSASGRTPYVLGGVGVAHAAGVATIGLACVGGSPLGRGVDVAVEVITGAEIVAGSTRLKAGTAQKIVLNAISTIAMVRLGHTYGNLMVDLSADNGKLRRRAVRAIVAAAGVDVERASAALDDAAGEAKVAIVAELARVPSEQARRLLDRANGQVRSALTLADDTD
jgi:N-acetylmuramic acid 6-phosphate etherase